MKRLENIQELTLNEASEINGGGPAFEWVGKMLGRFNEIMKAAVEHGYEHAGLYY